jgi:signal transduction histidine kinase
MDQMIFEYHILRQVIVDVLEEEGPLTDVEREIITSSIEQAVNDAATQFGDTLRIIQERLTSTLAHDLRSPITAAKMCAQSILKRPDNKDLAIKTANMIVTSMDRLDSMIRDLLDASRLQAGQSLPLQFEEFDLDLITKQIVDEFNQSDGDRFVLKSPGSTTGYWNKNGLSRVIENLATNAAKYGVPSTPITITIEKNEQSVRLIVHNEGKPIPIEEQAILFQQYRRSKSTEAKEGWGLGLTVVKGITEAHHGKVQVESTEGSGTSFSIELPLDSRIIQ